MAVRTIGVKITGKDDVKKLQKEVKKLQDAVALVEKSIGKVGGSKSPTFSVKVKLNSSEFNEQYKKLKQKYSEKKITFKSNLNTKGVNEDFKKLKDKMNAQSVKILVHSSSTKKDAKATLTAMRNALSDFEIKAKIGVNKTYFRASVQSLKKILDNFEMNLKVKVKVPQLPKQTQKVEVVETKVTKTTPKKETVKQPKTSSAPLPESAGLSKLLITAEAIRGTLGGVTDKVTVLYGKMLKMSLLNPMGSMLKGIVAVSGQVLKLNTQLETMVRTTIMNHMQNAFYTVLNNVRNIMASVVEETKEIGDSLVTYKLQMEQVGHSPERINSDLKDLTNYGKTTVYDASDLIQQAGNYTAYGRDDSIELVKALAGLSAHTKDPNESLEHIGLQLNDVLARQKVTWQDVRIMKTWFNAQGSKAVQDILQNQAEQHGYASVGDAMKDNLYTVDDLVNAIKQVGNDPSFQQMVATIATPTQALDNLKENLSNLFIVPDYNDDGSVTDAPLQKTYDSITNFIKALSQAVDDNRLKMGVRAISRDLSKFIDSITRTGNELKKFKVTPLLNSFKDLRKEFQKNKKQTDVVSKGILKITNTMINFNKKAGRLGESLPRIFNATVNVIDGYTRLFAEAINKGAGNAIAELFEIYANLANLAVDSGAVDVLAGFYTDSYTLCNMVLTSPVNVQVAKNVVASLAEFMQELIRTVDTIVYRANAIAYLGNIIQTITDTLGTMLHNINSAVGEQGYRRVFTILQDSVEAIVKGLATIYGDMISSSIKFLGSGSFKVFVDTAIQLLQNINRLFYQVIASLGNGDFEQGLETIVQVLTQFLQVVVNLTEFLNRHPRLATALVSGILVIKVLQKFLASVINFASWLNGAKSTLTGLGVLKTGAKAGSTVAGDVAEGAGALATTAGAGAVATKGAKVAHTTEDLAKYQSYVYDAELLAKEGGAVERFVAPLGKAIASFNYGVAPMTRTLAQGGSKLKTGAKATTAMFSDVGNAFKNSSSVLQGVKDAKLAVTSSNLVKNITSTAKGITASSKAFKVATGLVKGITGVVGGWAMDKVNNAVQKSNAPKGVKNFADTANTLGQGALTGGMLGSFFGPIGTAIGAVSGATLNMALKKWKKNLDKEAKEAQKQVDAQIEEQKTQEGQAMAQTLMEHFQQLGEVASEARRSFSKALGTDDDEQALQDSISYLNELSSSSGTSMAQQLRQLGINAKQVPEGINDMYVQLNGQLVKWTDLKKQTGLTDEELLGSLELVDSSVGQYYTYLRDKNGNVVAQVQAKTQEAQQRDQQQVTNFIDAVNKRGITIGNLDNANLQQIDAVTKTLEDAVNGSYYTVEEKKQALASALANGDENLYNQYMQQKVSTLEELAKGAIEASKETTGSAEEQKAAFIEKYKEVTTLTGDKLKEKIKKMGDMTVEEIQEAVKEEEAKKLTKKSKGQSKKNLKDRVSLVALSKKLGQLDDNIKGMTDKVISENSQEIDVAIANLQGSDAYGQNVGEASIRDILNKIGIKDTELQNQIIGKLQNGAGTLQEAIDAVQTDISGDMEDTKAQLRERSQGLFESVLAKVNDGSITLDQGIQILSDANVDPALISTEGLSGSAQGLYDGVATKNTVTEGKLQEMANKVNEKHEEEINTDPIATALKGLWDAIKNVGNWVAEKIGEIGAKFSETWNNLTGNGKQSKKSKKSGRKQTGGIVEAYRQAGGRIKPEYHATGDVVGGIDWKPKGTDTVPTMLTPGEYVLRKKAVDSLGVGFLNNLNKYGVKALETVNNTRQTIVNNYYNNNANLTQNIDNKSQYLNGMDGLDRLMRYV